MNLTFTDKEMADLLSWKVGDVEKRKLCGQCDHYDSVKHAGLKCTQCGGEMVSVANWTIGNLLARVKPTPRRGEMWITSYSARYLSKKEGIEWSEAFHWALENHDMVLALYRKYRQEHG